MRVPDLVCFEIHFHLQLYSQGIFFVPHPGSKQGAATQGKGRVEGRGLSDTRQCLPGQLEKQHKQTMKLCFSSAWGLLVGCHGIVSLLESVYLLWRGPWEHKRHTRLQPGAVSHQSQRHRTATSWPPGRPAVLAGSPGSDLKAGAGVGEGVS